MVFNSLACARTVLLMEATSAMLLSVALSVADSPPTSPLTTRENPRAMSFRQHALLRPGDPQRGKNLFFDSRLAQCSTCHRVNGQGGDIGPDLSHIGGKFDRPHLIESILEPSRQIVEEYRVTVLTTDDGHVWSGIIQQESSESVVLVEASGERRRIPKSQIEERHASHVSLMAEGLEGQLTPDQFVDVIAFLERLAGGAKSKPGENTSGPLVLPVGFAATTIATGLTGCTAMEVTPDGALLLCEQPGALRIVRNDQLQKEPLLQVTVDSHWERGLIGVTTSPRFPREPWIYVCYVVAKPYPHHRVSRWTIAGDRPIAGSEMILLDGDDQTTLGGEIQAGHQGGALHFGIDGKLYVSIGEQTAGTPSQNLDALLGKILRMNPDGTIPDDNPFVGPAKGKYQLIWALGLRNPFGFAIQPDTGRMFINDVGGKFEEVNEGVRGANYGWPLAEHGPTSDPRFRGPIHYYPTASIVGGAFCPADSPWPAQYRGKYFFLDFVQGWIKVLDPQNTTPEKTTDAQTFVSGIRRPVDARFAPDGSLYVLVRNAWVIDREFSPATGSLLKIQYELKP